MNVAERKWKLIKLVRERFASFRISDRPIPVGAVEVMISCCGFSTWLLSLELDGAAAICSGRP
jgi:hypothetical protein